MGAENPAAVRHLTLRTGRCRTCQKRAGIKRAFVYRWKPGRGRELYRARCPRCSSSLDQTTFNNLKDPHVSPGTPDFVKLEWETAIGKHDCVFMPAPSGRDRCIYCRAWSRVRTEPAT